MKPKNIRFNICLTTNSWWPVNTINLLPALTIAGEFYGISIYFEWLIFCASVSFYIPAIMKKHLQEAGDEDTGDNN